MLGEFALDEAQGELGGVDVHRAVEVLQKVGQRAGVVLVAVGDDDTAQLVGVLQHVGVIGQDEIHTRMVVVGKHQARVVQDHVAAALEGGHVLADGVQAAERDDAQLGVGVLRRLRAAARAAVLGALGTVGALAARELGALALEVHPLEGGVVLAAAVAVAAVAAAASVLGRGLVRGAALVLLLLLVGHRVPCLSLTYLAKTPVRLRRSGVNRFGETRARPRRRPRA